MPAEGLAEETHESEWKTINGRKVEIKHGQDPQEAIREHFASISGAKGQATRESRGVGHQESRGTTENYKPNPVEETKKHYFQRYHIYKSPIENRTTVTYNKYNDVGMVAGKIGTSFRILNKDGDIITVHEDYVFKTSDFTKYGHWDALSDIDRAELLKLVNQSDSFIRTDWSYIPQVVKDLLKATSPAGYDMGSGGFNTGVQGRVNPVSNEQTVSERIRQEISRRSLVQENTPPKILEGNELNTDMEQNALGQQASSGEAPKSGTDPYKEQNGEKPEFEGANQPSTGGEAQNERHEERGQEENPLASGKIQGKDDAPLAPTPQSNEKTKPTDKPKVDDTKPQKPEDYKHD